MSVGRQLFQLPVYWLSEDDYHREREERLKRWYWQEYEEIARDADRQPEDYQTWRAANLRWETQGRPSWRFNHIGGFFEVFIHGQTVKIDAWVRRGRSGRFARTRGFTPVGRVAEAHFAAADNGRIRDAVWRAMGYAEDWFKGRYRAVNWWVDCDDLMIECLDFEEWLTRRAHESPAHRP